MRRVLVVAPNAELATPGELASARRLGRLLGENSITALTDGSPLGAAGTVVDAVLTAGGSAIGVVLTSADERRIHPGLTERRVVSSQAEREAEWAGLADAVLALPGGFPTLDGALQVCDWSAISSKELPLGLIDEDNYYSLLFESASDAAIDRFVRELQRGRLIMAKRAEDVLRRLADFRPPETRRG
jgi:uncharacterized protein (TIGR00730 family)